MTFPRIKDILIPSLFALMLTGCGKESELSLTPADSEGEITITLRLPVDDNHALSRAYPTGGEDGDGREPGLDYENQIFDANLLFFSADGLNPEDNPAEREVTCVYVTNLKRVPAFTDDSPFEKTITIKVKTAETDLKDSKVLSSDNITFVTVLNAGKNLATEIGNLDDLRKYSSFSSSFRYSADNGYENFIMTTAYDADRAGIIEMDGASRFVGSNRLEVNTNADAIPGDNWNGKKWIGETTVQRLCARVDLMYSSGNSKDGELVYSTPAGHTVRIQNILPVNFMTKPSYLLTKTTTAIPADWGSESDLGQIVWGGAEKCLSGTDFPANYIIDPYTLERSAAKKAQLDKSGEWYGTSAVKTVKEEIKKSTSGKVNGYPSVLLHTPESNDCDMISIIGYANENIQSPDCYSSPYITGLAFRAEFQPKEYLRLNGEDFEVKPLSDKEWKEKTSEQKTFWRYRPAATLSEIKDGDALYFFSEEEAEAYKNKHPEDLAEISSFHEGVCYYNLWLRHYNDESYKNDNSLPKDSYPMEYAIVRNNIYRVAVSFTGPGTPTPEMREPDTMQSRIFVRKWNKRIEKNPLQF